MDFLTAIQTGIARTLDFQGRSRRSEFWWFTLFSMLVVMVAITLDRTLGLPALGVMPEGGLPETYQQSLFWVFRVGTHPIETLAGLLLFIPLYSLIVRRLHDTGRSGYWALLFYGLNFVSGPTVARMMVAVEAEDMTLFNDLTVIMILMVNVAASLLYLVFMIKDSDKGPNQFGPSPKA